MERNKGGRDGNIKEKTGGRRLRTRVKGKNMWRNERCRAMDVRERTARGETGKQDGKEHNKRGKGVGKRWFGKKGKRRWLMTEYRTRVERRKDEGNGKGGGGVRKKEEVRKRRRVKGREDKEGRGC